MLPFKPMLKDKAYPRNQKVENLGRGATCHALGSVALRIDGNPQSAECMPSHGNKPLRLW